MSAKYEPVLRRELEAIEAAIKSNEAMGIGSAFSAGNMVRIRAGHPMEGISGRIEAISANAGRLWMNIEILGRAASLEIDMDLVEAA